MILKPIIRYWPLFSSHMFRFPIIDNFHKEYPILTISPAYRYFTFLFQQSNIYFLFLHEAVRHPSCQHFLAILSNVRPDVENIFTLSQSLSNTNPIKALVNNNNNPKLSIGKHHLNFISTFVAKLVVKLLGVIHQAGNMTKKLATLLTKMFKGILTTKICKIRDPTYTIRDFWFLAQKSAIFVKSG